MPNHSYQIVMALLVLAVSEIRAESPKRLDLYGDSLPEGVLARMGTERLRHPSAFRLAFPAGGETLISAGQDQTVRVWNVATGKLQRLQRLPASQLAMALSPDVKTVALTSEEHLHIWDISAAKEIQRIPTGTLKGSKELNWVEFSPDGKSLVGGNLDGTVFLWDAVAGKERTRFQHKDRRIGRLAFSPDGKWLAASGGQHILLWDLAVGKELRTIVSPRAENGSLIFSPDGGLLFDSSHRGAVLWDLATGKKETVLQFHADREQGATYALALAPDGKTLAIGFDDRVVLWDRATHKEVTKLKSGYSACWGHERLYFSPNGKLLAFLWFGKITLWDVASGKQLHETAGHSGMPISMAFSPDGQLLASADVWEHGVRLWDAHSGKLLHIWPMSDADIYSLLFTPEGAYVIAGTSKGDCRMWDARSGKELHVFRFDDVTGRAKVEIGALHLSPDGRRLTALSLEEAADGGPKRQRYLTTWQVASGKRSNRRRLSVAEPIVPFVEKLSPDGKLATIWSRQGLLVYDVVADRPLRTFARTNVPVAISPDSRLLAVGGYVRGTAEADRVRVFDMAFGSEVLAFDAGRVWHRAFSPDSRYLLTAGDELRLWELVSGKEVARRQPLEPSHPPEYPPFAGGLAFAPDGRSMATGLADGNLLIWDVAPATRQKRQLTAEDLDQLWANLAGEDAARAYQAAGTLIADPLRAIPYLRDHLPPVKADAPRIRQLIADLDSEQFAVRDAARKELEKMDDAAYGVLREALKQAKSLEMRRRMEALLTDPFVLRAPEKLRQVRAVMVLEQVGDAAARQLLERLAGGAAGARLTREAKTALRRLKSERGASAP